jgi:hypothetical protein
MGLKIVTSIGTDRGITSEAYVRIADYQVSKYGSGNFRIELFQTKEDSVVTNGSYPMPAMGGGQARNQQIGENLWVSLTKEVEATRTVQRSVEVVTPAVLAEDGTIETPESRTWEMQDVEETYTTTVPDLSALEDGTIFAFAYGKLKEKLVGLFGEENVVDC